jgi:flagellar protein FliS
MTRDTAKHYLEMQITTASKEQLLLMLFDGAIRFSEQAKEKIAARDIEGSHKLLIRAQRIMIELLSALDRSVGDELYGNLSGLYNFIYFRLVRANVRRDAALIDEALKILRSLRETWGEAVARAQQAQGPIAERPVAPVGVGEAPRISVEG